MFADWVLRIYTFLARRRTLTLTALGVAVALSTVILTRTSFDNSIDRMLPDGPARDMLNFLREARFSSTVVVSLEDTSATADTARLFAAADQVARALHPPHFRRVTAGFTQPDLMNDAGFLFRHAPSLLDTNDLASIAAKISPDGVDTALRRHYLRLLKPDTLFFSANLASDPLEIDALILDKWTSLSRAFGYEVRLEQGHFLSQDGRHTMLLAETSQPLAAGPEAHQVVDTLRAALRDLPPGIRGSLVCGHTHMVSNEDTIQRDLGLILTIASLSFTILYILFFRDPRGLLVFLVPTVASAIGLGITALLFPHLSFFVLAFSPVVAGIADDYGITLYVALRHDTDRRKVVHHLAPPILAGACTTSGSFIAFFCSGISGYNQLGLFCVISIFLSAALALLVLPAFLKTCDTPVPHETPAEPPPDSAPRLRRWPIAVGGILLAVAAILALRTRFDSDVTRLDGTSPDIVADENRFREVWQPHGRQEGFAVVSGTNLESVLEINDAIYRDAAAEVGATNLASLAAVWPSARTRAANRDAWHTLWNPEREARLRGLLASRGPPLGFTTNAFDRFFARLRAEPPSEENGAHRLLENIQDRFIHRTGDRVHVLTFFPDDPAILAAWNRVVQRHPGACFLVSRVTIARSLSDAFSGSLGRTAVVGAILIMLIAFLYLRSLPRMLVTLTPALSGVLGTLAVLAALHKPLNVGSLIAGIVVLGICVDFGMHMLHAWEHRQDRTIRKAIALASATTVLGAGVLVFARHPILHTVGLTLVVGIACGYFAAVWFVPALCEVCFRKPGGEMRAGRAAAMLAALALLGCGGGCCSLPSSFVPAAPREPFPDPFRGRQNLVFEFQPYWWWPQKARLAAVGYAAVDRSARACQVTCLSPLGLKLFDLASTNGVSRLDTAIPLPGDAGAMRGAMRDAIAFDLVAIFLDSLPPPGSRGERRCAETVFTETRGKLRAVRVFDAVTGRLLRKTIDAPDGRRSLTFEASAATPDGAGLPGAIVLRNHRYGYTLRLFIRESLSAP